MSGPGDEVMPKHYAIWPYTGVTYRRKEGRTVPPSCITLRFEVLSLFCSHAASYSYSYGYVRGTLLVAQLVEALRYNPEGRGFEFRRCYWNFPLRQSFRPHCGPGIDSASNRNEYREYFLREERWPVRRADKFTTFMCRLSRNLEASTCPDNYGN